MKKIFVALFLLFSLSVYSIDTNFILGLAAGMGISGAEFTNETGESFGSAYFDNWLAFENEIEQKITIAKRMNLTAGFEFNNKIDLLFSVSYSDKPVGFSYVKKEAEHDFVVYADYEFIEVGLLFKHYLKKPFFYGFGFHKGYVISEETYYAYGDTRYKSYLDWKKDSTSFNCEIGLSYELSDKTKLESFINYFQDMSDGFPYTYFYEPHKLIDITFNLGIITKI